jgi:hypothetical protein
MNKFVALLRDDRGFIVSSELVLIATIVVIGLITGLVTVRDQVIMELADVADAISEVDQSYSFSRVVAHAASTAGTQFNDEPDFCEDTANTDQRGNTAGTQCLVIDNVAPLLGETP